MSYFWQQISSEDKKVIEVFKEKLELIDSDEFLLSSNELSLSLENHQSQPPPQNTITPYTIAHKAGINLNVYTKDGPVLQAIWVYFLLKLKSVLPVESLKYRNINEFLNVYPEFILKDEKEQMNLFHTANWMVELFKMIPANKNKGLTIMIVPKLVEGWEAKYITGSGQKEVTANRVKIFEHEGSVKPNSRGKQTWKSKIPPPPKKAKSVASKRFHKVKKANRSYEVTAPATTKREGLRQHINHKSYEDHDLTDEENSSVKSAHHQHQQPQYNNQSLSSLLVPSTSQDEDEFMAALSLFRQNSNSAFALSLSRANSLSLSLSRAVSASSALGKLDTSTKSSSVIDFDKFAPATLSPISAPLLLSSSSNNNNIFNGNGYGYGYGYNGSSNSNGFSFVNNNSNNNNNNLSMYSNPSNSNGPNSSTNYFASLSPRSSSVGLPLDM